MDDATALAQYGVWAEGLDREAAANALLAIGIVAFDERPLSEWSDQPLILERLTALLTEYDRVNHERRWNQQFPCIWIDPLTRHDWDPEGVPHGSVWAEAWDGLGTRYQTLSAVVSSATDLVWLKEILTSVYGINCFIGMTSDPVSAWRFPLRVGCLPTAEGRALHHELTAGFAGSSWRSVLIDPVLMSSAQVYCDVLVVERDAWSVPTALLDLRELKVGAVFVATPPGGLEPPTMDLVHKIVDITGAWAAGFFESTDTPMWIVHLVEALSHAQPLDRVFDMISSGRRVLVADPKNVILETADQRASRLAHALRGLTGERPARRYLRFSKRESMLATDLARIAEEGAFLSEAGDASEVARLEGQAGELLDRAGAARRIKARITAADEPDVLLHSFRPATGHTIDVHIGTPGADGWLAASEPFPEPEFTNERPHELTVVLTEPTLLPVPQRQTILLPVVGDSTSASFTLTTRADTTFVDARIIVLSGNRVLQTVRLPGDVDATGEGSVKDVAVPELVVAPPSDGVLERRTFAASFLVNRNEDGVSRATAIAGDTAAMVKLDSPTVTGAVEIITGELISIADYPENYGALDAEASIALLVTLANHGSDMRDALVTDTPGLEELIVRPGSAIQIVAAKPDAYFPFEFAYEFPPPKEGAELCPQALSRLADPDPTTICTEKHTSDVVCPLGFWALRYVIERHAFQSAAEVDGDFLLRSTPNRRDHVINLGPTLFAASKVVDDVVPGGVALVSAALEATGAHVPVEAWPEWKQAAQNEPLPVIHLLLAHTVYSNALKKHGLEIGTDSVEHNFKKDCLAGGNSVVLLLACATATATKVSFEGFPAKFRIAGAKVVIATLTDVLGRHTAPVAAQLITEIHRQCGQEPKGMGDVMLAVRRQLLAEGLLPVLTLTTFGDADWLLGP